MVITSGVSVDQFRADKGSGFISHVFQDYFRLTGVFLDYASTNALQHIGTFERVGKPMATMIRCMLPNSRLTTFLWRGLMSTGAYLGNKAPHPALVMLSSYTVFG